MKKMLKQIQQIQFYYVLKVYIVSHFLLGVWILFFGFLQVMLEASEYFEKISPMVVRYILYFKPVLVAYIFICMPTYILVKCKQSYDLKLNLKKSPIEADNINDVQDFVSENQIYGLVYWGKIFFKNLMIYIKSPVIFINYLVQ
ncbi:hypothetical protein G7062_10470 [Erysipelothrix sp. HDW6C]|uniref:hypothetical protein n=1 Tax=Erysipelothrix sp. HDW6C TaxID=2714930 RepID=UPI00140C8CB9|nr:hypothetical protein [Erysipelothrix sp. HDW6C]QIK70701.1 hypothetical protein G7062_10470 [Erysipelothrix sp. HDW6C]